MSDNQQLNRRNFIKTSIPATTALTVLPRHVLANAKSVSPNDKINVGYVGCGTQGFRNLMGALPNENLQIIAVCDPNRESTDYVAWGKNELRNKIRKFLDDPKWDEGVEGCRCGRVVGKEIVERYYSKNKPSGEYKGCPAYIDFRDMLDKEKDLDAVYIMTPDHLHGTVAITAMRQGKHAITHKPIANVFREIQLAVETSIETNAATHLFCAAGNESAPTICEWIWNGAIGPVREVHNWSSRPFWPQGMTEYPPEQPVPDGLEWDLWLGPVPHRPYNLALTHAVFRGWYDFGAGSLGDMGHYSFHQIFEIMKLGSPISVEAGRSQYWEIVDRLWNKQENMISYPRASMIHWEFPERDEMPPMSLYWYDGGLRPPKPVELDEDGKDMPNEGMLFVGDKGKILAGFSGGEPRLIPEKKMKAFTPPPKTLPRPIGELEQWIRACQGGPASDASFPNAYAFSETIAIGNIALRVDKKLKWHGEKKEFTNSSKANELKYRKYREGWEL